MKKSGIEFDPGFGPYILAFRGTIEYLYMDINRFKNFTQRKMKFRQYYKKFIELYNNNLGFYIGCLMWAVYIKSLPKQKILNNSFLNQEYDEEGNISDIQFMMKYHELFPKDMKYFLSENYEMDKTDLNILEKYKEFLILNKGFTVSEYNTDIVIPEGINTQDVELYKEKIDNAIKQEDLSKLTEFKDLICKK